MSSRLPARREKRHSSKPYDRPKSFLQRVTKHVADYIPSWLNPASWVGGQTENPPTVNPDEETGEEEDYDIAGPSGLSSPVTSTSTFTRKPLERSPPTAQQTLVNGDDHSDNSETSASTSGCSSLAPSQERKRAPVSEGKPASQLKGLQVSKRHLEKIQKQLNSKPQFTIPESESEQTPCTVTSPEATGNVTEVSIVGSQRTNEKARKRVSVEPCASPIMEKDAETSSTRTSLWSEDDEKSSQSNKRPRASRPQPVAPNKRPCFSVSAFGSPLRIPHERTQQTSSETTLSPFYQGNTTFGGASAYKRARVSTPYNSVLHAEAMKVRQMGSTGVLSSAAQKVLNILENMSTPLTDAKKIPVENVSTDFALSYTPSIYARRPLRQDTPQSQLSSSGPPRTSYPIQTSASSHKPSPLLAILNQTATSSRTVGSVTPVAQNQSGGQEKSSGGAMRSGPYQRPSRRTVMEDEPAPAPPDLPQVSLVPEGSVPTFSFSIPTLTSTPIVESHPFKSKKEVPVIDLISEKEDTTDKFLFSSPIENKPPLEVILDDVQEKDNFQFRSPVIKTSFPSENEKTSPISCPVTKASVMNFNFASSVSGGSTSPLKRKKAPEPSSQETVAAATGPAALRPSSELFVGRSVMDILGKPAASAIQDNNSSPLLKTGTGKGFGSAFQKKASEWDCDVCMVRNKDAESVCVACSSPRPSLKSTSTNTLPPISSVSGFGSKFAPPSDSWSCPTCMINNNGTSLSCVACSEPKPGAKLKVDSLSALTNSPKSKPKVPEVPAGCPKQWIGPPVASTAGTWECDTCLVRNKEGVSKCCSCETPRANAPTTGVKETFTGFKFGQTPKDTSSTTNFKFGVSNTSPLKTVSAPSGFGLTSTNTKDTSSQSTTGFKFGIPVSSDSTPGGQDGFKFGLPISKDSPAGAKLSETFRFGAPVTKASDSVGNPTFAFGSSTTADTGGFKFGTPIQPNSDSKRTDKETEVTCEVVSSTVSAEAEGKSAECGDANKFEFGNKNSFVFGGQSTVGEKKTEATPTLTFGQKAVNKPALSTDKPVSKPDETEVEKSKVVAVFGDATPKPAVSEQGELSVVGQGASVGFKFGAGGKSEVKQVSSTSVNSGSEKQSVNSIFSFGRPSDSGSKTLAADPTAPAVSSSFQFTFKGKENDSEQTAAPTFGTQQVSSTIGSFTTTATCSTGTPKSAVAFSVTQPSFSTTSSTSLSSVNSTGTQNSATTFVFGTPKPSQAPTPSTGGFNFTFGNSTPGNNAAKPAATTLPFTFGSSANSTNSVPPAPSTPFTFGKAVSTTSSNNGAPPQATPVFSFGTPANAANSSTNNAGTAFGTPQTSKPVFGFGTPGSTSTATPAFGQAPSVGQTPASTEPFTFGTSSAMVNSTAPSGSIFQMDAAKPVTPALAPVFRFGAAPSESGTSQVPQQQQQQQQAMFGAPQSQSGPGFTFGAPTVPSTGPTPFADSSSPFVFGSANTPANPAQPPAASVPAFAFQAGNTANNPFSVTANAASGNRPIRKAIRRVAKKK